jgi:hypothetical protein
MVDASLGQHAARETNGLPRASDANDPSPGIRDASLADANDPANEPPPVMSMHDAGIVDEPPLPTVDASDEQPVEMMDASDEHPVEPDAHITEDAAVVEPPPGCDIPTDNMCLTCDQTACCEQRRSCLEIEPCACNLECYYADNPAACREECGEAGERYPLWLGCIEEHCAEPCPL